MKVALTLVRGWRPASLLALCLSWWAGAATAALPIEHWTQSNGARVYLVRSDNLPMLDVQIDVDGGSRRDPPAQAGLAAATALMLTLGIQASPAGPALDENAVIEAWADLGAQFGASAGSDRLSVQLRTLTQPDVLDAAVALAGRQLAAPAWADSVWARERARLTAAWREAQTRPDTLVARHFAQAVYRSHPYGQEARPETWGAIDTAALRDFYLRHARACDARVTLIGAVDRATATRVVDRLLAGWGPHGCAVLPPVTEVQPLAQAKRVRVPFAAAQAQILVGQPGIARDDPDFLAMLVGNHILGGGGFTSRLMQELREKRGLTYGVFSQFSPGRHAGAFSVSVQTRPDQADQAVDLVHAELRRFVAQGPTEQELNEAKAALVNGFALRLDSNRKLLDNVAALAWHGLPLDYLDRWTERVTAIDRGHIVRAWQRVLHPDRLVTVVVGAAP